MMTKARNIQLYIWAKIAYQGTSSFQPLMPPEVRAADERTHQDAWDLYFFLEKLKTNVGAGEGETDIKRGSASPSQEAQKSQRPTVGLTRGAKAGS